MATKKKPVLSDNQKIGLGVGLTAAVAAAAGTFFLYGSKGASKNRKTVKSWALKAKAEVLETLEKAQNMSKDEYEQLIDTVSGSYSQVKEASKVDLVGFKKEMKDYWGNIAKTAAPKKKAVKKAVKKASETVKKEVTKDVASAKKAAAKVAKKA